MLRKALQKDPGARYVNLVEFIQALMRVGTLDPASEIQDNETHKQTKREIEPARQPKEKPDEERTPIRSVSKEQAGKSGDRKTLPSWLPWGLIGALELVIVGVMIALSRRPPVQAPNPTATPVPSKTAAKAPTSTTTKAPANTVAPGLGIGSTMIRDQDGMEMVYVPASKFTMGSNEYDFEQPIHQVYLDAYWIDKYEVTNGQYEKCVAAGSCSAPGSTGSYTRSSYYGNSRYAEYPVIYVRWHQADAYCQWAGGRLPSEAEWEKAARGTEGYVYPMGDNSPNAQLANYNDNEGDTTEVGSYAEGVSLYGAMDMAGNVWEWVADWYDETYYTSSPLENPTGPDTGTYLVLRGGSWSDDEWFLRASYRYGGFFPDYTNDYVGFRCATSP